MRYTLRLLTAQQFQRATALVCAAEMARLSDEATWGTSRSASGCGSAPTSARSGSTRPRSSSQRASRGGGYRLTVLQIQRCPWCGTHDRRRATSSADAEHAADLRVLRRRAGRVPVRAGRRPSRRACRSSPSTRRSTGSRPAFLIATVDKFARLAREGEAASLFGYVSRRCDRHGYVHPDYRHCDIKDGSKHRAEDGLPAAAVRPVARLRPPDLIIQDELHLITGALGTTVGPVRGRRRRAVPPGATAARRAGAATARRLDRDRAQRAGPGPRAVRA